jgi:ABC-2 type transport system permease protein
VALVLFVLALVPTLIFGAYIYLANNVDMLTGMGMRIGEGELTAVDGGTFFLFLAVQTAVSFLLTAFVGPGLVAPDLAHGALPLYLSRPFGRREYVLGKLTVMVGLLSLLTWVPGLLLVGLQAALAPAGWLGRHARIPLAVFAGSWVWILTLSLLALAISAWVRWRPLATGMLFIVFIVGEGFGRAVNGFLDTRWGNLFILDDQIETLWMAMFGDVGTLGRVIVERPLHWSFCALTVAGAAGLALALFTLRVRAQEVSR